MRKYLPPVGKGAIWVSEQDGGRDSATIKIKRRSVKGDLCRGEISQKKKKRGEKRAHVQRRRTQIQSDI